MKQLLKNLLVLTMIGLIVGLVIHMDIKGVQNTNLSIFLGLNVILLHLINKNFRMLILGLISCVGLSICPMNRFAIQTMIFCLLLGISTTSLMMPRSKKTKKQTPKRRVSAFQDVA